MRDQCSRPRETHAIVRREPLIQAELAGLVLPQAATLTTTQTKPARIESSFAGWAFALSICGLVSLLVWQAIAPEGEWHVVAARNLAAFLPIGPNDLQLVRGRARGGEFASLAALQGRYPFAPVERGEALREKSLSAGPWLLAGRDPSLLAVPLTIPWNFAGWTMPLKATLIASSRASETAAVFLPVLIVAAMPKSVVVSTAQEDRPRREAFLAALGSSDVYVAVTAR